MGRTGSECSSFFGPVVFMGWVLKTGGKNILLRQAEDLGGRSCIVLDDKDKMHLKGLVTYGGEERAAREPGRSGRK